MRTPRTSVVPSVLPGGLLLAALAGTSCTPAIPAFEAGIRDIATIVNTGPYTGEEFLPAAGASDYGAMQKEYGGGTGAQGSFTGMINGQGYDDHVEAITDAVWNLYGDFTPVNAACGIASGVGVFVPTAGLIHNPQCIFVLEY